MTLPLTACRVLHVLLLLVLLWSEPLTAKNDPPSQKRRTQFYFVPAPTPTPAPRPSSGTAAVVVAESSWGYLLSPSASAATTVDDTPIPVGAAEQEQNNSAGAPEVAWGPNPLFQPLPDGVPVVSEPVLGPNPLFQPVNHMDDVDVDPRSEEGPNPLFQPVPPPPPPTPPPFIRATFPPTLGPSAAVPAVVSSKIKSTPPPTKRPSTTTPTSVPTAEPFPRVVVVVADPPRTSTPTTRAPTRAPTTRAPTTLSPTVSPPVVPPPTSPPVPTTSPTIDPFGTTFRIVTEPLVPIDGTSSSEARSSSGGVATGGLHACRPSAPVPTTQQVIAFAYHLRTRTATSTDSNNSREQVLLAKDYIESRIQSRMAEVYLECRFVVDLSGDQTTTSTSAFHVQSVSSLPLDTIVANRTCAAEEDGADTTDGTQECHVIQAFMTVKTFTTAQAVAATTAATTVTAATNDDDDDNDTTRRFLQEPERTWEIRNPTMLRSFTESLDEAFADPAQLVLGGWNDLIAGTSFLGVTNAAPGVSPLLDNDNILGPTNGSRSVSSRGAIAGRSIGGVAGALFLLAVSGLFVTAALRRRKQRRHIGAATAQFQKTWESDEEGEGDEEDYDDYDDDSSEIYGIEIDNEAAHATEAAAHAKEEATATANRELEVPQQDLTPAVTMEESEVSGFTDTSSSFRTFGSNISRLSRPKGDPIAHVVDPTRSFITAESVPFPDENKPDQWQSVVHELKLAEDERYIHQPSPPERKRYKLPDTMAL